MILKALILFAAVISTGLWSANAVAVEALATEELKIHCDHYDDDPTGTDGVFCVRYVQGFIDGAIITDQRVMRNVAKEHGGNETLTKRAMRTRMRGNIERFGPSYYAEFCLGNPVPLREVVEKVVGELQNDKITRRFPLARSVIDQLLRREYPCKLID